MIKIQMSAFSKMIVTITPGMSLTVPSQIAKNWEAEAQQTNETQTFAIFPYFPLSSVCKKSSILPPSATAYSY